MLFAFIFNLWATTLAAGAAAVSIPIIIHLLNRRRFKIVDWAAMRFLLAAQRQTTRKMRLEQIILLAIRCLLILLLVLAMAAVMPWAEDLWASIWPEGALRKSHPSGRTHHILVVDGSLSMSQTVPGAPTAFQKAVDKAVEAVNSGRPGDGYSLLFLKDNPSWEMGAVSQIPQRVIERLREFKAAHGNGSLASALNMVNTRVLDSTKRYSTQVVYVFTDLQRSTWQSAVDLEKAEGEDKAKENILLEIQEEAQFALIDVGREKAGNFAVVDLYLTNPLITTGQTLEVTATIQNFSENPKTVLLDFLVAKAKDNLDSPVLSFQNKDSKVKENVSPGRREDQKFQHTFKDAGTYVLQVRVKADEDKLEADNSRYLVITVKEKIPILVVCGMPNDVGKKRYLEKVTDLLKEALNPAPGEEDGWTRLMPHVITQDEFARMKREELSNYECLFLADITAPSREEVEFIEEFLRRGRGVLMSLGDLSARDLNGINDVLYKGQEGLLPARLDKKIVAPAKHFFTLNADGDAFQLPPLKAFSDARDRISLASRPFEAYVQTTPASPRVRTILTYALELEPGLDVKIDPTVPNGDAALLEWHPVVPGRKIGGSRGGNMVYPGKFVLLTTTLHKRPDNDRTFGDGWNYWAGSPSYVAMLQELVRLTVPKKLIGQSSLVSEPIDAVFASPGHKVDATVSFPIDPITKDPTLKSRTLVLPPQGDLLEFRFGETDFAGVYRVTLDSDGSETPFAVNFPAVTQDKRGSECNLLRAEEKDLQGMFPGFDFQLVESVDDIEIKPGPRAAQMVEERAEQGPDIARILALMVLIFLFLETILAWQFGHYSTVEGTTPPAPVGASWPLFLAAAAFVCFAIGALVLIHNRMTGDFLSFLPDRFRSWTETKVLGLEPPPPGETSRWTLESRPWLPLFLERNWFVLFLSVGSLLLVFAIYKLEGPSVSYWFKGLLAAMRFCLILMVVFAFLPQLELSIVRQGMPEIVLLVDDSMSMGVTDNFQKPETREKARQLHDSIRATLKDRLPTRINELKVQVADLVTRAGADPKLKSDLNDTRLRLEYLESQLSQVDTSGWKPSRLNLAQAVMLQPEKDWLTHLFKVQRQKVHVFHLDALGKATKLTDKEGIAGDLVDPSDLPGLERAKKALAALESMGKESQLGLSLREVINQYRGASLTAVIMVTDGVTTRDESIKDVAEYARRAVVPLYFFGIGDDHVIQNLELDGLQVDDTIYLGDRALFQAKIIGKGHKDLEVPIVLKMKEKDGREREVDRVKKRVDPDGKPVKFTLTHTPGEAGKKHYIIEVEIPKSDKDKTSGGRLRLERTIEVIETKQIKVLYVEQQPRYEYRYLKALLERESPDKKKQKSIDVKVLLLEADENYHKMDSTALRDFPATREELEAYDVIIMGDCDPRHPKLGDARLKMIADYVRGDDGKGKRKSVKNGAGLLFLAGPFFNPHAYRDTPLGPLLPVEPLAAKPPPEPDLRAEKLRLEWTTLGRLNNLFKLVPDDSENTAIWKRISPMFWWSTGYKARDRAEVLAVHPAGAGAPETKHPLIVQQLVGAGRSMFFGFEETWRWRFREDEVQYNRFWIQTLRYMARVRQSRTELRLDRQTPYRDGDTIKVTVTFPDTTPGLVGPEVKEADRPEVIVIAEHQPESKEEGLPPPKVETQRMALAKVGGSMGTYEGALPKARAGSYNFWLYAPDVRKLQPDGEAPSASAKVELPPQEMEDLRINQAELTEAAQKTRGRFYTLGDVDRLLEELPEPERPNLGAAASSQKIWNHWFLFATAILLFSAEWILRKKKHLL